MQKVLSSFLLICISTALFSRKKFDIDCIPDEKIKVQYSLPRFQNGELGFKKLFSLLISDTIKVCKALKDNTLSVTWEVEEFSRRAFKIEAISLDTQLGNEVKRVLTKMYFWECGETKLDSTDMYRLINCQDTIWNTFYLPPSRQHKVFLKPELSYQLLDTSQQAFVDLKSYYSSIADANGGVKERVFRIVPSRPGCCNYEMADLFIFKSKKMKKYLKRVLLLSQKGELSIAFTIFPRDKPDFKSKFNANRAGRIIKKIEKEFGRQVERFEKKHKRIAFDLTFRQDFVIFLSENLTFEGYEPVSFRRF